MTTGATTATLGCCWLLELCLLLPGAQGDIYLNNPRGSNNKLSEQSNAAQNQNRLFDSQNNDEAGYQICDKCSPVCHADGTNNYDATKEGAMQGQMHYYAGSCLYVEWHMQHACGVDQPNTHCEVILQYMCDSESPNLRDGTQRGNDNTAGGQQEPPEAAEAADPTLGQHETVDFYNKCKARERNKGLYVADQNVADNRGATATRQNPNGNNANNRNGLECPEERDYYPYWHASEWHDIAVITDETERCTYYQEESQNVKAKSECSDPQYNNEAACREAGATWQETPSWGEDPPECVGGIKSRDNHNGNVKNGQPYYYLWCLPEWLEGTCALRVRYNITTRDFEYGSLARPIPEGVELTGVKADYFHLDATYNGEEDAILTQDPRDDYLGFGTDYTLQLQVNTNQYGRTFEDRTHSFKVLPRPPGVAEDAKIWNLNVRGRRGNIVQVYPSVEYDFVPPELHLEEGDCVHFQWCGSDANPQGNDGNGKQGTDRSNLVQVADSGETLPLPIEKHSLFFNAEEDPENAEGRRLVTKFAFLDQDSNVECDPEDDNGNSLTNCAQLNGASAYFDGGLQCNLQVGEHHVLSTRNSDFSNRSHKSIITVSRRWWEWYLVAGVLAGAVIAVAAVAYLAMAIYALKHPGHWLFGKQYRPRILSWCVRRKDLEARLQERRELIGQEREKWMAQSLSMRSGGTQDAREKLEEMAKPQKNTTCLQSFCFCCRRLGLSEIRLTVVLYTCLNMLLFLLGFWINYSRGFKGHIAYPIAKGGGFMLNLDFAVIVLPTLKSLQTGMRRVGSSREWLPIDDPISFHICVAAFILLGSLIHIGAHCWHSWHVASSPRLQEDPLELWQLTFAEEWSGKTLWEQLIWESYRAAPVTGILLTLLLAPMYLTAMTCVRRATNRVTRRLGGFNLFFRVHLLWPWAFLLLLLHGPLRTWIWLFFPAILIFTDRMLLSQQQKLPLRLREVKVLPRDVMGLVFDVPPGFTYQAGQYIQLGWKDEWHPFTLTSAPEEGCISVHIRAPDSLDWCSALRRHLTEELPMGAAKAHGLEYTQPRPGCVIKYRRQPNSSFPGILCRPQTEDDLGDEAGAAAQPGAGRRSYSMSSEEYLPKLPAGQSCESIWSTTMEKAPEGTVALQVTGPFGAPAQKVWQFETIMVVGAGIGVTPFASILRSVQLRLQQREIILRASAAAQSHQHVAESLERTASSLAKGLQMIAGNAVGHSTSSSAPSGGDGYAGAKLKKSTAESLERLVSDVITVPKKICFYWIVRGQEEFDWFYELLQAATEGPAKDIVEISVFVTGEMELSKVKELKCATGQWFGRPNWARIFKQNKEKHGGKHIGVFLCGSPIIGDELARQSTKNSDPLGTRGGTRFSFFKEHF